LKCPTPFNFGDNKLKSISTTSCILSHLLLFFKFTTASTAVSGESVQLSALTGDFRKSKHAIMSRSVRFFIIPVVYSSQTNWVNAPLTATSQTSTRTQVFPLTSVVKLKVCLPKACVSSRGIFSRNTLVPSPEMISTKLRGKVQSISKSTFAVPLPSSLRVSPDPLPSTVKEGRRTSPVVTKNLPPSIASNTGCQPSSNLGNLSIWR